MNIKKKLLITLLLVSLAVAVSVGLASCGKCAHEWGEWSDGNATCTEDGVNERTCTKCGEVETGVAKALGHNYSSADCTAAKTCSLCGATDGEPLGHKWAEATCIAPKSCERCDATEGTSLGESGHTGGTATCSDRATCSVCGTKYGTLVEHSYGAGVTVKETGCLENGEVKYTCSGCGAEKSETVNAKGHSYVDTVTAPTCLEVGYTTHTCSTCDDSYTDRETAALGHRWDKAVADCESGRECTVCDAAEPALEHNYSINVVTAPGCETEGYTTHTCSVCGDNYVDTVLPALGHVISGAAPTLGDVEGETCKQVEIFACTVCGGAVKGEIVASHTYKAAITTAATCIADGVKTVSCDKCDDSFTEKIEKNESAHNWQMGAVIGVKRIDSCSLCGTTKTVTVVDGNVTPSTSAEDLKDTEIQMNNANISLDNGVIDTIGNKNVTISADKLEGDDRPDTGLNADQLKQIGDNPIYNFTMNDGSENISAFGEDNWVTITIPYILKDGDDVDNIAIWFLTDEGEVESFRATYSNGYVSFKTNHFSYYTVTRLTPRERCEVYGHNYTSTTVAGTCTTDGYDLYACIRCADTYRENVVKAPGHTYVADTSSATCTTRGNVIYTCHCGNSYTTVLPALGHSYELDERQAATCSERGYEVYGCIRCDDEYTTVLPKISHKIVTSVVAPTCENVGYTLNACSACDYSYTTNVTPAIGHSYGYVWAWSEDNSSATLTFTCANDAAHTSSHSATVTSNKVLGAIEKMEYYAKVVYNGTVYEDTKIVVLGEHVHAYVTERYNAESHWLECECGDKSDIAAHAWTDSSVITAETCGADGEMKTVCSCGCESTRVIPATGNHSYTDGACTVCGAEKNGEFYINLLTTPLTTDGITVTVKDLTYEMTRKRLGTTEKIGSIEKTKITELAISYKDGELYATATGGISIFNGPVEGETVSYSFDALIEDGYLYLSYFGDANNVTDDNYIKCEIDYILTMYAEERFDYDVSMIMAMINHTDVFEKLDQILTAFMEANDEKINLALEKIFAILFTVSNDNGIYNVELDFNKIKALVNNLGDMDVDELVNHYFGEDAYNKIADELRKVANTKMKDLEALLQGYGVDTEMLFDLVEDMSRFSKRYIDIDEMLADEEMKNATLGEVMFDEDIEEILEALTKHSVNDIFGFSDSAFDDIIEMLDGKLAFGITTDSDGFIKNISLELDPISIPQDESYTYTAGIALDVDFGAISEGQTALRDKINSMAPNVDVEEEEFDDHWDSAEFYVEYNGKIYYFDGYLCTYYTYVTEPLNYTIFSDCNGWYDYSIMYPIHGVKYFSGNLYDENDELFAYAFIDYETGLIATCVLGNGDVTITRPDGSKITMSQQDDDVIYILGQIFGEVELKNYYDDYDYDGFYYNPTTGEFSDDSKHDFTYKYDVYGANCSVDGVQVTKSCNKCGYYQSYKTYGHQSEQKELDLNYNSCNSIRYRECVACDAITYVEHYGCNFNHYMSVDGKDYYRCDMCSLIMVQERTRGDKDDNCTYYVYITYTFCDPDGVQLATVTETDYNIAHRNEYSYVLHGESCVDGVTMTEYCLDCDYSVTREYNYGDHPRMYYTIEGYDYGFCDDHHATLQTCPCGRYTSYGISDYYGEDFGNEQTCDKCDWRASLTITETVTDCVCNEVVRLSVYDGNKVLLDKSMSSTYAYHDFKVYFAVKSGKDVLVSECRDCGVCREEEVNQSTGSATLEEHNGEFYYDVYFTPEHDGYYEMSGANASDDTYGYLYHVVDGDLIMLHSDDDSGNGSNFKISYYLYASETYVLRVRFYQNDRSGVVYYSIKEIIGSTSECLHNNNRKTVYTITGGSCSNGVVEAYLCVECGCVESYEVYNSHISIKTWEVYLTEHGACSGYITFRECACGKSTSMDIYNLEYDDRTENVYTDERGNTTYVETYYCGSCALRITNSYYEIVNVADCEMAIYRTITANIGDRLIGKYSETEITPYHDSNVTFNLLGDDCYDGVDVTSTCKHCGYVDTRRVYSHEYFEIERVNLHTAGSTCDGYATFKRCACGMYADVNFDNAQCDFDRKNCDPWITNYVPEGWQYNVEGYYYYTYNFEEWTCAVTDPEACGFKVRYASYWQKSGCYATLYHVWEIGYDESTGSCVKRFVVEGTRRLYHNYERIDYNTDIKQGYENRCRDCGSVDSNIEYYSNGVLYLSEIIRTNTLNNEFSKSYHYRAEYSINGHGDHYRSLELTERVYANGTKEWTRTETNETVYNAPFGQKAVTRISTVTYSHGGGYTETSRVTYYKGYTYTLYSYRNDFNSDYWYENTYTYSFVDGCTCTRVYRNHHGDYSEETYSCHHTYYQTVTSPTCTQDGTAHYFCDVCERVTSVIPVDPIAHEWISVGNTHVCRICLLENVNGASGVVVMEDLTASYGNGVNYVVGYWARNNISFQYYVSIILKSTEEEIILNGINIYEHSSIRALYFSISEARAAAARLGYSADEYDLRIAFVPEGSDGSFDYAITFGGDEPLTHVTDDASFNVQLNRGETYEFYLDTSRAGTWEITSMCNYDTYGYIYVNENHYTSNDDGAGNGQFILYYEVTGGESAKVLVRFYSSETTGSIRVFCNFTAA